MICTPLNRSTESVLRLSISVGDPFACGIKSPAGSCACVRTLRGLCRARIAQQSKAQAPHSAEVTSRTARDLLPPTRVRTSRRSRSPAGRPELVQFASRFAQKAGQPFSQEKVDQTAAALKAAGKFEMSASRSTRRPMACACCSILEPAVYFGMFQFPGAGQFPYSRLVQIANYPIQTPFNAAEVERDRQSLLTFFRQAGYFQAEVQSEVKVDAATRDRQYRLSLPRWDAERNSATSTSAGASASRCKNACSTA